MIESIDPDSCRYCDNPRSRHAIRWVEGLGYHNWIVPTDEQRLTRMRDRRSGTGTRETA